ncbi:lipocalin family protein [Patescibacteria group bacterium]|nr:lipocalin family protein [Patescibacteria group bacterium]
MKNMFLILSVIFSFFSCNDDDNKVQEKSILGSWKLIEVYGSDGGQGQWTPIENGYVYEFRSDNTLLSNRFSCNGTYQNLSDSVLISFDCDDTQFNASYEFSFEGNKLILSNSSDCDEGCVEKYEKVTEE